VLVGVGQRVNDQLKRGVARHLLCTQKFRVGTTWRAIPSCFPFPSPGSTCAASDDVDGRQVVILEGRFLWFEFDLG
jgi:hypothetical protein